MGLPRVEQECWRGRQWGHKYMAALERLIEDPQCDDQIVFCAERVLKEARFLHELMYQEARRIQAVRDEADQSV